MRQPLRLAWFRAPLTRDPHDLDALSLLRALQSDHVVDVIDERGAHEFVWKHFRQPYDACVYELGNSSQHAFIWPYVFHYPGVLWLRTGSLHDGRAIALEHERRIGDYAAEFLFNHGTPPLLPAYSARYFGRADWPMLRAPVLASKAVVVPHHTSAALLQQEFPDARIHHLPACVDGPQQTSAPDDTHGIACAVIGQSRVDSIERARERARDAGANITLLVDGSSTDRIGRSHVVLALDWPSSGEPMTGALLGMAAGKPTVVFETEATAHWAALDPQIWRPRGPAQSQPVVVSVDPRDEEHSLVSIMRRLAADAVLRSAVGKSAQAWWVAHATPDHVADCWTRLLIHVASLTPPARPQDWPPHLTADGTQLAREILGQFGETVDFLQPFSQG